MLASEKVDQFYNFLSEQYYGKNEKPKTIILISPNHFHNEMKYPITVCKNSDLNYKTKTINSSSKLIAHWIACDGEEKVFYSRGETLQTYEHWIWEHFQRIEKYFPNSEVIPIVIPSFWREWIDELKKWINKLAGNILVIASVDFAHYLPEEQTLQHDNLSIETLKSWTLKQSDFIDWIDADCPTCLYLLQSLAIKNNQKAELWWRDSSSTIVGKDMWTENTSRIFMRYK